MLLDFIKKKKKKSASGSSLTKVAVASFHAGRLLVATVLTHVVHLWVVTDFGSLVIAQERCIELQGSIRRKWWEWTNARRRHPGGLGL